MALTILEALAIDEFLGVINRSKAITKRIANQLSSKGASEPENKYRSKGREYQAARSGERKSITPSPPVSSEDLNELTLHNKIVKHPFLLHTPELYFGELMLDAIIDEFPLPSRHVADFAYVSGHNQVIRITLVEIERAAAKVFKSGTSLSAFHGDTKKGIKQVEIWKESLKSEVRQKALLLSLKPLLKNYPIPLFTVDDNVGRDVCIEIGYVLISGNEEVLNEEQMKAIDNLYLDKGILFMTYPMMVEQVKERCRHKHIISLKTTGVKVKTCSTQLPPYGVSIDDRLGVKMAGLGLNYFETFRRGMSFYPESIREIFYRSAGVCEIPNCSERIIHEGELYGHLEPIRENLPEIFKIRLNHHRAQNYTAALCEKHRDSILRGVLLSKEDACMMLAQLAERRPYRPELDCQLMEFMSLWMEKSSKILIRLLKKSKNLDESSKIEMAQWLRAFMSVPLGVRPYLVEIILDDLRVDKRKDRSLEKCESRLPLYYLVRAGLLRINLSAPLREQIEPVIFSSRGSREPYSSSDIHTLNAFANSCDRNGHHLYR